MCGRYNLTDSPMVQALLDILGIDIGPLPARFNICPTEHSPVICRQLGQTLMLNMRWWLVPSWSSGPTNDYAMFNARAESLLQSKAYALPFKKQRCIIPATSFIEWQKTDEGKLPRLIQPKKGVFAFAGIWDYWKPDSIYSFSIITTEATSEFRHIHSRMPVMLKESELAAWLNLETDIYKLLPCLEPRLTAPIDIFPIEKSINNVNYKETPRVIGQGKIIP